jgi:hypothetical protein
MKTISKAIGGIKENKKFDYFAYFAKHKDEGRVITHAEFVESILKSRAEKSKQQV